MTSWKRTMLVLAFALGSGCAWAVPCAGFTDVDSTSDFCPSVEWLKNRAITLGCTATEYCPWSPVSRLAMAAFMSRLGTALTPMQLRVDAAPGAIDLDLGSVVCQTSDFAVVGFPRRAFVDLSFSVTAPADVTLAADVVQSIDGGGSWATLNSVLNRGSAVATQWGALSDVAYADVEVGQTVRWGVRLTRGGAPGATDVSDSRCQLRVLVHGRNGATSPY